MPRQNSTKISPLKSKPTIISNPISPILVKNNNTLFSSIKEGFGFGIGSTIARNMVNSVMSPTPVNLPNCIEYKKCLESNNKYECFGNLDQKEYLECKTMH
jgi:hypothetical protein